MADKVQQLRERRRSLTAQIRAAQKEQVAAQRKRVADIELELGEWVLLHLFQSQDDSQVEIRAAAARSALEHTQVTDYLRQHVLQTIAVRAAEERPDHENDPRRCA